MTDAEIRTADPADVIQQYRPLIYKAANRYRAFLDRTGAIDLDDLIQAGMIAIMNAQRNYQPDKSSFVRFSWDYIRCAIRRTIGLDGKRTAPAAMVYLDDPINEDDRITILDTIPDPNIQDNAERLAEDAEREELSTAVHEAVDRLKNYKHREVITRMYFQGQKVPEIATATGIPAKQVYTNKDEALKRLRHDWRLERIVAPSYSASLGAFRNNMSSVEERIILWKEKQEEQINGPGAFVRKKKLTEEEAADIRRVFDQEQNRRP